MIYIKKKTHKTGKNEKHYGGDCSDVGGQNDKTTKDLFNRYTFLSIIKH